MGVLWVALGGACGAAARYGISLLPVRMDFPVLTLATNFLGALLIGVIVGLAGEAGSLRTRHCSGRPVCAEASPPSPPFHWRH